MIRWALVGRVMVTLVVVAIAAIMARGLWQYYIDDPWTRDGHVLGDVVSVAPDVSGLVDDVIVHDNSQVHRGDILFEIDHKRFQIALEQAQAAVLGRKSALDQARRDFVRSQNLGEFTSRQSVEENGSTLVQALAAYQQTLADLDLARLNLERSTVRASVSGFVTNLSLQPGDYVSAGNPVVALIDTESIRVEGYFEETKLVRIHTGDLAIIRLMGGQRVLYGTVESISGGIADQERTSQPGALANVNPTFTWVRLAQRVPVRIKLNKPPKDGNLIIGLTATIYIRASLSPARNIDTHISWLDLSKYKD